MCSVFLFRDVAVLVAGGTVAAAALALPAALSGDPDHSQRKQHSQYYQRDDPAKCHIHPSISLVQLSAPKYTRFAGKEQQPAAHFLCRAQPVRLPGGNVARPEHGMAFLQPEKSKEIIDLWQP